MRPVAWLPLSLFRCVGWRGSSPWLVGPSACCFWVRVVPRSGLCRVGLGPTPVHGSWMWVQHDCDAFDGTLFGRQGGLWLSCQGWCGQCPHPRLRCCRARCRERRRRIMGYKRCPSSGLFRAWAQGGNKCSACGFSCAIKGGYRRSSRARQAWPCCALV
jgi:hypothetical protein